MPATARRFCSRCSRTCNTALTVSSTCTVAPHRLSLTQRGHLSSHAPQGRERIPVAPEALARRGLSRTIRRADACRDRRLLGAERSPGRYVPGHAAGWATATVKPGRCLWRRSHRDTTNHHEVNHAILSESGLYDHGSRATPLFTTGHVERVQILQDRETGRSRGFGLSECRTPPRLRPRLRGSNGRSLEGRFDRQ